MGLVRANLNEWEKSYENLEQRERWVNIYNKGKFCVCLLTNISLSGHLPPIMARGSLCAPHCSADQIPLCNADPAASHCAKRNLLLWAANLMFADCKLIQTSNEIFRLNIMNSSHYISSWSSQYSSSGSVPEHPPVVPPDTDYLVTGPDCECAGFGAIMSILTGEARHNLRTPENSKRKENNQKVSLFFFLIWFQLNLIDCFQSDEVWNLGEMSMQMLIWWLGWELGNPPTEVCRQ